MNDQNIFSLNTYSKPYSTLTIKYLISDQYNGLTQIPSLHSAVRRWIGLLFTKTQSFVYAFVVWTDVVKVLVITMVTGQYNCERI